MRSETFIKGIGTYSFIFEKLVLRSNDAVFFISNDMPGARSFFMSKIEDRWQILYHNLLSRHLLKLESELAAAIMNKGY